MVIYSLPTRSFIEKLPNKTLMTQPPPHLPPQKKTPPAIPWSADRQASSRRDQTNTRVDKLVQSPHRSDLPGKLGDFRHGMVGEVPTIVTSKKILKQIPSGEHTKSNGKSPFFYGKIHYKWPFSIAMLVHQRVDLVKKITLLWVGFYFTFPLWGDEDARNITIYMARDWNINPRRRPWHVPWLFHLLWGTPTEVRIHCCYATSSSWIFLVCIYIYYINKNQLYYPLVNYLRKNLVANWFHWFVYSIL